MSRAKAQVTGATLKDVGRAGLGKLAAWMSEQDHAEAKERISAQLGMPVQVVTQEAAEEADVVVCVYKGEEDPSFTSTNVESPCADCGKMLTYRPHAPKRPPKVCVPCANVRVAAAI